MLVARLLVDAFVVCSGSAQWPPTAVPHVLLLALMLFTDGGDRNVRQHHFRLSSEIIHEVDCLW